MGDNHELVRPATPAEIADVPAMHAANRAAWDEAAERYEGWFDEAAALIRSGGTNLFGAEVELIGDLHGRCRRAIHLQCAGGRDTLSLWNHGAAEVVGVDFSPRMLDLAARLAAATGAPARWVLSDVLDTPHELDGTGDVDLYVRKDAAATLVRAVENGATVVFELRDIEAGERQATIDDVFGHRWLLTQTLVDTAPEQWGGKTVTPRR